MPDSWQIRHDTIVFELKCTDSGAIGVYPEQATNWDWIAGQVCRAGRTLKILNLFAYTGGSTLAAAAAGAEVVHVDAARSVVNWARHNAELAGLECGSDSLDRRGCSPSLPSVRCDEVAQYDAVILDPPTYGHGPKAQPWKLTEHLDGLLSTIRELTQQQPSVHPADLPCARRGASRIGSDACR